MKIPPEIAHLTIPQIAAKLGVTAQGVRVALRRSAGLCPNCGRKATAGIFCAKHHRSNLVAQRKRTGHKPWKPGSPGRPPARSKVKP